ncbi:GHKL domain-containing protein [bacterium]|nr:GHKL domain-containing protein [bacterium]
MADAVSENKLQTSQKVAATARQGILLLGRDSDFTKRIIVISESLGFSVLQVKSASLALTLIADADPVLFVIDTLGHDLSLEDICYAMRIPRQVRPLGLLVTEQAGRDGLTANEEWGIDGLVTADTSDEQIALLFSQQARVTSLQRRIMDRENEILDSMPNALIEISGDTVVWKANRSLAEFVGIDRSDFRRNILGFPVLRTMGPSCSEFVEGLSQAVKTGETSFRGKALIKNAERLVSANITPLRQNSEHYLVELRDITDEQQAVLAEARRERLATIGNLAVGAAHEIQNPNTFSRVNAENLKQLFGALKPTIETAFEGSEAKIGTLPLANVFSKIDAAIHGVETASRRIEAVISTLKTFGRSPDGTVGSIDPLTAIQEAILLTKHELRTTAELKVELPDELPPVYATSAELSQVFVNLLSNAVKALADQKKWDDSERPRIRIHVDSTTRQELVIAVSDNGPGIKDELKERIFRPYYTTRRQGEGTGLGLSISSDIMHRFNGDLSLRSEYGKGATFLVNMKRADIQK